MIRALQIVVISAILVFSLLVVYVILASPGEIAEAKRLEKAYGFTGDTPYVEVDGEVREVFMIESVTSGGAAMLAGLRAGDVVAGSSSTMDTVQWGNSGTFYSNLNRLESGDVLQVWVYRRGPTGYSSSALIPLGIRSPSKD